MVVVAIEGATDSSEGAGEREYLAGYE